MEPDPVWGSRSSWNPVSDIDDLIQADPGLHLGLLQTWACRPKSALTWEKSGVAQDPDEAMMATDPEPQPADSGPVVPPRRGEQRPAVLGFCLPAALTLPLLSLPTPIERKLENIKQLPQIF